MQLTPRINTTEGKKQELGESLDGWATATGRTKKPPSHARRELVNKPQTLQPVGSNGPVGKSLMIYRKISGSLT
jgi:hypothetical protein